MGNKSITFEDRIGFLEQLKPLLNDSIMYGRVYANLYDLIESSDWLIAKTDIRKNKIIDKESLENFLIDLDIHYIQHVNFHLDSLREDVCAILDDLTDEDN